MSAALLSGLNTAQSTAVTSAASVLQVLAPPGSGKTKTLTSRVAYLLTHYGYQPQNVICCTFTIKASREMRERLRGLIGCDLEQKLILGTFHSICRRYLLAYGNLIDIPCTFSVADSTDSANIVKKIIKRLNLKIEPKTVRARISSHKAKGKTLQDLQGTASKSLEKQDFILVFQEYEAELRSSNLLDYDDLLIRCVELLRAHPNCVANVDALLIDEFQDTNVVQFELMKLLASAKRQITIVGDPDQSIYGFRSAEIENLQRMKRFYPETIVINLEENYRSAPAILKLAQEVIEQDTNRPNKKLKATHTYGTVPVLRRLPNPHEEAKWIATEIKRMLALTGGVLQHNDFAILLRSAFLSLLIEKAFAHAGLPYRMVGGHRFFDRVEIRLIVDYLRVINHPDNNPALLAVINTPSRKIGESAISEFVKHADAKSVTIWTVLQKVLKGDIILETKISRPAEQNLSQFVKMIQTARSKIPSFKPAEVPRRLIEFLVDSLSYKAYVKSKYKDDWEERLENVEELITHASDYALLPLNEEKLPDVGVEQQEMQKGEEVLSQFLSNIVLSTEVEKSDTADKSRITISTIHSAKGLEWPVVFIPAVYEGSIPHSRAEDTDEERRLLYVAVTRAQAFLTMSFPIMQSREQGKSVMSPFLPEELWPATAQVGPIINDKVVKDVASILRRDCPSAEALVDSLDILGEGASMLDDLWPSDGTPRTDLTHMQGRSSYVSANPRSAPSGFMQPSVSDACDSRTAFQASTYTVGTTMSNVSSFSVSSTTLGFTSASYQLKTMPPQSQDTKITESKSTTTKGSKGKVTTQVEKCKISNFFSAGVKPKSEESLTHSNPNPTISIHQKPYTASLVKSYTKTSEPPLPSLPQDLSRQKHNLSSSTAYKRPRAILEETDANPNSKRYLFLSSSPTKDATEQKHDTLTDQQSPTPKLKKSTSDTKSLMNTRDILRPSLPKSFSFSSSTIRPGSDFGSGMYSTQTQKPILSRPTLPGTSMHTPATTYTAQPGLLQYPSSSCSLPSDPNSNSNPKHTSLSNLANKDRKTLGVRRSMNGWAERTKK